MAKNCFWICLDISVCLPLWYNSGRVSALPNLLEGGTNVLMGMIYDVEPAPANERVVIHEVRGNQDHFVKIGNLGAKTFQAGVMIRLRT